MVHWLSEILIIIYDRSHGIVGGSGFWLNPFQANHAFDTYEWCWSHHGKWFIDIERTLHTWILLFVWPCTMRFFKIQGMDIVIFIEGSPKSDFRGALVGRNSGCNIHMSILSQLCQSHGGFSRLMDTRFWICCLRWCVYFHTGITTMLGYVPRILNNIAPCTEHLSTCGLHVYGKWWYIFPSNGSYG